MAYKARLPNSFRKETKKLPGNIKLKVIKEIKTISIIRHLYIDILHVHLA